MKKPPMQLLGLTPEGSPILACERVEFDGRRCDLLLLRCPRCQGRITHGAAGDPGPDYGSRAPHYCRCWDTDYSLREVSRRKARRDEI